MKNKKVLAAVMTAAIAASLLAACKNEANKPTITSGVESAPSSAGSAPVPSSQPEVSSEPESSSAASLPTENIPTESQPGQVIEIQTDDKEFNAKFEANPIDKAYIKESNNAISNIDMVNVSNKFSGIWQKEVTHAYSLLEKAMKTDSSMKPKTYQKEQQDWLNGKAQALKKISTTEQAAGGSMVQVNVASKTMDFYRSRAAQLYKELYGYDKNFTYEFKP